MTIREMLAADRDAIQGLLTACGAFTAQEVRVALEIVDLGVSTADDRDYWLFVSEAEVDGRVRGYVCVGQTPLTRSTWHLYWICVHPESQGQGLGRRLQDYAERFVRSRGGERLVLETSGKASYTRARAFYQDAGYAEVGRIPDFYQPGDDGVVFCKSLVE